MQKNNIPEFHFESFTDMVGSSVETLNGVFKGTDENAIAILIASPSQGKSHLSTTIALEASTGTPFLGVCTTNIPKKVLIVSKEDGRNVNILRSKKKAKGLSDRELELTSSNLFYLKNELNPICIPSNSSYSEKIDHAYYLERVAESFSDFDLVIFDTLTEVCGSASTVTDELQIKLAFQELAKRAGVAILLVHHVTKETMREPSKLDMASATGITSLIKTIKLQFALKETKSGNKQLIYLKANELTEEETNPIDLVWTNDILMRKPSEISINKNKAPKEKVPNKARKVRQPAILSTDIANETKQKMVTLDGVKQVGETGGSNDMRSVLK